MTGPVPKRRRERRDFSERGARKRRQSVRSLIFFGFFLIVLVAVASIFFNLPVWRIERVEVRGLRVIPEEKIVEILPFVLGEHIFLLNLHKVEETVRKFPPVRQVRARRIFPNRIEVEIKERKAEAIVLFPDGSLLVDSEGVLLTKRFPISWYEGVDIQKLPVIRGIPSSAIHGDYLAEKYAHAFRAVLPPLLKSVGSHNFQLDLNVIGEVNIWVEDLVQVKLGAAEQLEEKMELFESTWSALGEKWVKLESIDLRFRDQPVLKYKS